jgi:hypothetical protein
MTQDLLGLGPNAGPERIGSWRSTQENWVLTQDSLALGPDAGLKKIGSWVDPRELSLDREPNSLGFDFRS